jgi:hypothetical protein
VVIGEGIGTAGVSSRLIRHAACPLMVVPRVAG